MLLEAARGWLTPAVLFVFVNLIIATIMAGHITRNPIPELEKTEPVPEKPDHYFG